MERGRFKLLFNLVYLVSNRMDILYGIPEHFVSVTTDLYT